MRTKIISFVTALALVGPGGLATPVAAEMASDVTQRLNLAIGAMPNGDATAGTIAVQGANGRYDRVASSTLHLPLALSADLVANGSSFKILKSHLVLKSEGAGSTSAVDLLADQGPVYALSRSGVFAFELNLQGPVAQNAVSLCNSLSSDERSASGQPALTMGVAVRWQVTTGRFTFKWSDYDRVSLSSEIVGNSDFYADQAVQEAEALVEATVHCEPLGQESAKIAATPKPAPREAKLAAQVLPVSDPAPTLQKAVLLPDNGKPSCDGGMLRQLSSGAQNYICLCPGNTARVATDDNGFTCEKRSRRR